MVSLDGFFVMDRLGSFWQIMEAFDLEYTLKMFPDVKSVFDVRKHYPSMKWPEISEVGFPKEILEEFENKLQGLGSGQVENRERSTLYKLIIAMAVDGYGYDPMASRSPLPKELEGILDRMGLSVSDDTIRKKLREASELMPRDDDTKPN